MLRSIALLCACLLWPSSSRADVDLVFLIDTTGSMAGEIREAKERVKQLADALASSRKGERIRTGVVAFRDRGDAYVTQVSGFSSDVEVSFKFLATLTADGGGDGPEDVLSGIHAALTELHWDPADSVEKQVFLIGDAPPHLDYRGHTPEKLIELAQKRHIVIHAIGCRSLPPDGVAFFKRVAYATEGSYQHIGRVRTDENQLERAMLRNLIPTDAPAETLTPVTTRVVAEHSATPGRGVRVDYVPLPGASSSGHCAVRIQVPSPHQLGKAVRVQRGERRLVVEVPLEEGQGSGQTLALEQCVPAAMPIDVVVTR